MTRPRADEEERLIAYLLGQSSADEQARIEERYFADPVFHEELRVTDRELIDRYVDGRHSPEEQERFEKHYLTSSSRRQRVEFARALKQSLGPPVAGRARARLLRWPQVLRTPALGGRIALAGAAVLIILLGGWLWLNNLQQPDVPNQVGQTPSPATRESPPPPAGQPPPAGATIRPPAPVATLILLPALVRSAGETPTLTVAAGVEVRLQLYLEENDYWRYQVLLRTAEGAEVWRQAGLTSQETASGPAIVLAPPAGLLDAWDYTIQLAGVAEDGAVEEVASYYFRVERR